MKKQRFSVEQITSVLQQVAHRIPVGDVCRQVGIAERTFYRWKKSYGSMLPSEALRCSTRQPTWAMFGFASQISD